MLYKPYDGAKVAQPFSRKPYHLIFAVTAFTSMDAHHTHHEEELVNHADIEASKPSKSRFLFLLFFFGFFVFAWAGCAKLWEHRFQNNEDVKIPENTTYDPKYK